MPERSAPGVVVFAGPTLPPSPDPEWRALLAACTLRPPAQRGDVLAALAGRPHTIVLIDGYFYSVPAVTHKELLYALDAGARVIGAASLGALRAAELAPCGMIGAGEIYRWYRDGTIDGDDEVALLHLPAEKDYRPLTVALVEVRYALRRWARRETVPPAAVERFVVASRRLPFTERDPGRILDLAGEHLGDEGRHFLERALAAPGIKQRDAARALRAALRPPPAASTPRARRPTIFLSAFRERYARPPAASNEPAPATFGEAWSVAQVLHPATPAFVAECRRRALLAASAHHAGLEPAAARIEAGREALETHLAHVGLAASLAAAEVLEEARQTAWAECARERFGGVDDACRALATSSGLPGRGEQELVALIEEGSLPLPSWHLVRSFVFSTALAPALALARAAAEVYRCFERRTAGSRITDAELTRLAAELWGCAEDDVASVAARRGLSPGGGLFPGRRDALERLAPAERLAVAINDYPALRAELRARPLRHIRLRVTTVRR